MSGYIYIQMLMNTSVKYLVAAFFLSECFMGNASSIHVCLISGKFREDSYIQQINTLSVSKAFRMPVMCGSVSLMEHILF